MKTLRPGLLALTITGAAAIAAPPSARADDDAIKRAEALFAEGRTALEAGDYPAGLVPLLASGNAKEPAPVVGLSARPGGANLSLSAGFQ